MARNSLLAGCLLKTMVQRMNEDWLSDAEVEPLFWTPQRLEKPSSWWGHVPFAFWLVATCRPRLLVELGTHHGVSYVAFCEAVSRLRLATRCYAVDTRSGDPPAGRYAREVYAEFEVFHDKRYSDFSQFARRRVDEARDSFINGSIDVLHIDGLDTYDSVRDDFDSWRPKLSERAVVLFHGSNEREGNFDVSQLFEELRRETPSFEFLQSHGLGVLAIGGNPPDSIKRLCALPDAEIARVRERFSYCGARWIAENERLDLARDVATLQQDLCKKDSRIRALDEAMTQKEADIEQKGADILELKETLEQRERDVLALKKAVMATTATIDQSNAWIAEKDTAIAEKDLALTDQKRQIAKVEAMLAERDAQQTEQDRILANQSNCIARMQSEIERLVAAIDRAEQIIARLAERYTATLEKRSLRKFRHALQVALFRLPVPTSRYKLVRNSVFFDKNFYLLSNPDVKAAGLDAAVHYLQFGGKEGRDPGPHFSETGYRALSPDVAATSLTALEHYETYGRKGGRRLLAPEPRRDQLGPDDGSAGATGSASSGAAIAPHKIGTLADAAILRRSLERVGLFDPASYLGMHEDVRLGGLDPWTHFLEAGVWEGRRFTTPELFARALSRSAPVIRDAFSEVNERLAQDYGEEAINSAASPLTSRGARIGVYCSSHGNFFMQEIADLVQWQLKALQINSHIRTENSDINEAFDVRIFVAPHEFFRLGQGANWRALAGAPGSVLFNVEQVQTSWFCVGFPFLIQAPIILDINFHSAMLLREMGCNAIHFAPPYLDECKYTSPQCDVSHVELVRGYKFSRDKFDWTKHIGLSDRPIDVLFVGTGCERRLRAIESLRELTDRYRFLCVYTHQSSPLNNTNYQTRNVGLRNAEALAQRSKIVLNVHRDWIGYFQWPRMVMQGFWQGACVVSDPGLPDPIFSSGTHFLEENIRHLPELLHWLLGTPDGRTKMDEIAAAGHRQAVRPATKAAMLAPMLDALRQAARIER
jgi:hypothetical protein